AAPGAGRGHRAALLARALLRLREVTGEPVARPRPDPRVVHEEELARVLAPLVDIGARYVEPPGVEVEAPGVLRLADERVGPQVLELEEDVQLPHVVVGREPGRRTSPRAMALEGRVRVAEPGAHVGH